MWAITKKKDTYMGVFLFWSTTFALQKSGPPTAALFQLFLCISLPQRGQVITMRPFPFGTRHTAPHWGQVK